MRSRRQKSDFTSLEFAMSRDAARRFAKGRCLELIIANFNLCVGSGIYVQSEICSGLAIIVIAVTLSPQQASERANDASFIGAEAVHADFASDERRTCELVLVVSLP
jgi:hypothetical protein